MPTKESYQREAWSHNVGFPARDTDARDDFCALPPCDDVSGFFEGFLILRPGAVFFLKICSCQALKIIRIENGLCLKRYSKIKFSVHTESCLNFHK